MAKIKSSFFGNFETGTDDIDSPVEETRNIPVEEDEEEQEKEEQISEEEEEKEQEQETIEEEDSDDADPFIDTINYLAEAGLITYDEDHEYEEEGEELLEKVFSETLEKRYQRDYIDSIPEEYQSIINHLQTGGTLSDWVEAVRPTDFDSINMEDESNQKQLIEDHLTLTGMDAEDIEERIQELEDLGTLEKAATTAVKYLKKNEAVKVKQYEQELEETVSVQKKQQEDALEDFHRTVLSTEDLKGIKLSDKAQRQELFDYITKPTNKKGESKYVLDNKNIDNQLALAYMSMRNFSFKDLEKAVETKVTRDLRKSLSRITDTNAKGVSGSTGRVNTESKKIPKGPWG